MQYPYPKPAAMQTDLAPLQAQCQAAFSMPDLYVNGSPDTGTIQVVTSRDLTAPEKATLDGIVTAYDGRPRRPRSLLLIDGEVNALSAAQKTAVGNDLYGASQKWATDVGPNRAGLFVLYLLTQLGLSAAQTTRAKVAGAAMFAQDVPGALVRPPYDVSVNIPGDEPYTP